MPKFKLKWIILAIIVILVLWIGSTYNKLTVLNTGIATSWSQVETQYQRRFDLIPQLEATVKGAANFEQSTFIGIANARTQWQSAKAEGDRGKQIAAANSFDTALSRLLVTVERYPDLKATQAFINMQVSIEGTENRIAVARGDYNNVVGAYNIQTKVFPTKLIAMIFGFEQEPFFESAAGSETAPVIDFTK